MTQTHQQARARRRGRIIFLGIALVFALPVALSWALFFLLPEAIPEETTNRGELLQPARPAAALQLEDADGHAVTLDAAWHLLLLDEGRCAEVCAERLLMTRQLRLSLNDRMHRLHRVLVVPPDADLDALHRLLDAAHPDLRILRQREESATRFFEQPAPGTLHLLDPLGNWMMRYGPDTEPKPLRKDIVRLLRASQIG